MSTKASITADQLQKDLTDRINQAGMTAKSVTCKDDLVGEVGKTAHCDVSFSDTNNVEVVFTATKVEGTTVSFEITPAMTKEQVEKAVAGLCPCRRRRVRPGWTARWAKRRSAKSSSTASPPSGSSRSRRSSRQTGHGAFGLCAAAQGSGSPMLMQRLRGRRATRGDRRLRRRHGLQSWQHGGMRGGHGQ